MFIIIWLLSIVIAVIVIGSIKHHFDLNEIKDKIDAIDKLCSNSYSFIDKDINDLNIECPNITFVDQRKLAKRGSWRMAQDRVITIKTFKELSQYEYSKML